VLIYVLSFCSEVLISLFILLNIMIPLLQKKNIDIYYATICRSLSSTLLLVGSKRY
jgi:hypothetical protein